MKNYYDILGVSKSSTIDEIKKAYRKLSLETHPDVAAAAGDQYRNAEKFKCISEAYSILGNPKSRKQYDFDRQESMHFRDDFKQTSGNLRRAGRGTGVSFGSTLPRNVFIGSILGFAAGITLLRMITHKDEEDGVRMKKTGQMKLVEAWKNPKTNRWEKPQPWDPDYQKLQPTLHFVPREEINNAKR